MKNVCYGQRWDGFITKPLLYLAYLKSLPIHDNLGRKIHVVFMDSDTFWAVNDIATVWERYDCARQGMDLVISTEMSCWVGRYCTEEDLNRYYSLSNLSPSYSPFLNSGVAMGTRDALLTMLQYVVDHKEDYIIELANGKKKFDDQYAIGDYALHVANQSVSLDYHQQLLGSSAAIGYREFYAGRQPFVCRNASGAVLSGCFDFSQILSRKGFFRLNPSCTISRELKANMELGPEMLTLSPSPIIWHTNGVGRRTFLVYGQRSYECYLSKRNLDDKRFIEMSTS